MPEQFGERTHEATPHRRQQARERGQVAKSQDLASAAVLIGALLILMYWGPNLVDFLGGYTRRQLGNPPPLAVDRQFAITQWSEAIVGLTRTLLPMLGLLLLAAVLASLGQVGFLFVPSKLAFDLSRIDPSKGVRRLLSLANVVRLGFGIFKIGVVAAVAGWSLWAQRVAILSSSELEVSQITLFVAEIALWTCLKIGAALLVLAILDYGFQWWKHEQDLKMTHQEMREELKTLQGDPNVVARRRAVQRQLVLNRLSTAVPKADVVVTNPTELAIALAYDPDAMKAPVVVAKGAGVLAQRIRRLALEQGIPILERKELAQVLYKQVDVNRAIPAEQYAAVAEVLRYVYQLKGIKMPGANKAA